MHDVIPIQARSGRLPLAVSFALFATAGVANTAITVSVRTVVATGLAVAGVYALAHYAQRVDRDRLARRSLALWVAFLAVTPAHVVGLETAAALVPGADSVVVLALTGLTWATMLAAIGTTAFLGFREYGATGAKVPEDRSVENGYDF